MVLTVFLRFTVTVLNSELRTVMQTAQAKSALIFLPYRFIVYDLYCVNRTFPCAKSAADAGILAKEFFCSSRLVIEGLCNKTG